ncbi:MAG: tetratricopeptide repeat protein [Verrucomicrobiota bacterium]
MPEKSPDENKLHLPAQEGEQAKKSRRSGDRSGGLLPPEKPDSAGDKNAGFWAQPSFGPRSLPAPDGAAPFPGNERPEFPLARQYPGPDFEPEGWESSPPLATPDDSSGPLRHPESSFPWRFISSLARRKISAGHGLVALAAAVCVAAIISALATWDLGVQAGEKRLLAEQTKADVAVSDEAFARLNQAFDDMRGGNPGNALKAFQELEAKNPGVSSMAYLAALAAMRSKNFGLAEEQAARSIRKRERVSDAITIQALLQIQKSEDPNLKKLGDQTLRSELLLRQAMLADPANPVPMIELASLLRRQRKYAEAINLLQAARSRVQPVDLPPFLEATVALATLEAIPDSDLPAAGNPDRDLPSAFSASYISMRKGHFGEAAKILKSVQTRTSPAFFRYLMNDMAIRPYSRQLELSEFFR